MLQTFYARWFFGLTVIAGILLPALLLWQAPGSFTAAMFAAAGVIAGYICWRILIFKIGVFEPIMSMNPFHSG